MQNVVAEENKFLEREAGVAACINGYPVLFVFLGSAQSLRISLDFVHPTSWISDHISYNMPSFSTIIAAAAVLAVSAAAPTKQGFTITQVPKNVGKLTHGSHLIAKTYRKFGKQPPTEVVEAAAAVTGSVTATPEQYDSEYLAPVSVGGSTLNLDFDTGSSDL